MIPTRTHLTEPGGILVFFVVTAGLLLGGCSQGASATTPDARSATAVAVQPVERQTISKVLSYTGEVAGEVEVKVYSTIPERIVALTIEEGQQVEEGALLASVRADTLGQGVRQAMGGLASARANVEGLRDQFNRQQRLLASGVVTRAQVDATRFQLQAAEATVAQLEASLGSARSRRSDANIRSPISGIVGQVFVEEGDMAAPQVPICTIVRMDRVEVTIQVPERDLGLVRPGMEADLTFDSLSGREFRAPVSQISPVVDRVSRTATLRFMLDNEDHAIRPGSLADVSLEVERHEDALVVPQYALVLEDRSGPEGAARYRAYVLEDDGRTVDERRVEVGIFRGDEVEITDGLAEGERLIVQGQHLLRDGSEVRVIDRSSEQEGEETDGGAAADGGAA